MVINQQCTAQWLSNIDVHPLRSQLTQELHARPFESLSAPMDIFLFAKFTGEESTDNELTHLRRFCREHQLEKPDADSRHHRMILGRDLLRWERHGEFTTLTFYTPTDASTPFSAALSDIVLQFLSQTEGQLLVATHLSLRDHQQHQWTDNEINQYFSEQTMVSANIASNEAQVWTDLQLHNSGYNRILLLNRELHSLKMGRVAQRLMDVSTYRNMALLALPIAHQTAQKIAKLDNQLSMLLDQLEALSQDTLSAHTTQIDTDSTMLKSLTNISMQIQNLSTQTRYRLTAADAYYALINSRITELNESRVSGYQTIGEFLNRRLSPAMRTCHSVHNRLDDLSTRISRAVDLLRTRLDLTLERQNHKLLDSMNKRVLVQMRLQETVEGLSIAAITYYCVGLVTYIAKLVKSAGININPDIVTGASVLPIAILVWCGIRSAKKRIMGQSHTAE